MAVSPLAIQFRRSVWALALCISASASGASLEWRLSTAGNFDYGTQLTIPAGFGNAEFTMELWLRPNNSFPVGPTGSGQGQLQNWSNADNSPYSSSGWWFEGNFLLDGHQNAGSAFQNGTFSLQFYGSGRLRWLFGDGASSSVAGQLWTVQAFPANSGPSLLDGQWHHVALVRRFVGTSQSQLELWIDGLLIDTETSSARTNMRQYWDNWSGFPANQRGWFWGAEKQAAIGVFPQYEDYKGLVDEVRYWSRAKTTSELSTEFANPVTGNEANLVGWYRFSEGSGSSTCNTQASAQCISLINTGTAVWNAADAPVSGGGGDTTAPSTPTGLAATAASSTQINLTWSASTDNVAVTSYRVRRNGSDAGTTSGTSFSDTGLTANTLYTYTVSAADAAGNRSPESASASATTPAGADTQAPSVPAGVQAVANSATQVTVTWTASIDNVGIANYRVRRNGADAGTVTGTSFVDTGRTANTTYAYTVSAADAAGNRSAESASASATTPAGADTQAPTVPTGLNATVVNTTQVVLAWTASSDNVGVIQYRVSRDGNVIGTSATASFTDNTVVANTTYSYTVSALDAAGNRSAESTARSVTTPAVADTQPPTAPTALVATASSATQVSLVWTVSSDNVAVTGYRVRRNGNQIGTASGPTFTDTTASPATTYSYTVVAIDAAGNVSPASNAVSVTTPAGPPPPDTTPPSIPGNLQGTAVTSSAIDVSWGASADNVAVTGYNVFRNGVSLTTTAALSFRDSGLQPNTSYTYSVVAFDAAGNRSASSNAIAVTTPPDTEQIELKKGALDPVSIALLMGLLSIGAMRRRHVTVDR